MGIFLPFPWLFLPQIASPQPITTLSRSSGQNSWSFSAPIFSHIHVQQQNLSALPVEYVQNLTAHTSTDARLKGSSFKKKSQIMSFFCSKSPITPRIKTRVLTITHQALYDLASCSLPDQIFHLSPHTHSTPAVPGSLQFLRTLQAHSCLRLCT